RAFHHFRQLPERERPTALFCDHDNAAGGVILEALSHGWRLPQDLSVVGFAGLDWTDLLAVPLTTVVQPARATGCKAVELLFETLERPRKAASVELPPTLLVRQSTAPCRS